MVRFRVRISLDRLALIKIGFSMSRKAHVPPRNEPVKKQSRSIGVFPDIFLWAHGKYRRMDVCHHVLIEIPEGLPTGIVLRFEGSLSNTVRACK